LGHTIFSLRGILGARRHVLFASSDIDRHLPSTLILVHFHFPSSSLVRVLLLQHSVLKKEGHLWKREAENLDDPGNFFFDKAQKPTLVPIFFSHQLCPFQTGRAALVSFDLYSATQVLRVSANIVIIRVSSLERESSYIRATKAHPAVPEEPSAHQAGTVRRLLFGSELGVDCARPMHGQLRSTPSHRYCPLSLGVQISPFNDLVPPAAEKHIISPERINGRPNKEYRPRKVSQDTPLSSCNRVSYWHPDKSFYPLIPPR
jgi:hypothetical protein